MTVAIAALSLPAVAEDNFSGGYVGVQAGAGFGTKIKTKGGSTTFGGTTMVANLLGGYGSVFSDNLYAGAEAQVGTGFGSISKTVGREKITIKNRVLYTVGGRFGYLPTQDIMVFASLAVGGEQFKSKRSEESASKNGFVMIPGIGAEFKVAQNLNVRADLSYKFAWHKDSIKTRQPIAKLGLVYKF